MKRVIIILFLLTLPLSVCSVSWSFSQEAGASKFTAEQVASFAKEVERSLAENGAYVAIVSRVGRPKEKLPDGFRYTHVALWVYSQITTEDQRVLNGYTIYNLYQDSERKSRSNLVQDYPIDFFSSVHELEAGVVIPTKKLQQRILNVINSESYAKLHNPNYSAISNPFNSKYQNCTEFVLDILNAAIYETDDIKQIKRNQKEFFEPQKVKMSRIKLGIAHLFVEDVRTNDHRGKPQTATFTKIKDYLESYNLIEKSYEL